VAAEAFSDIAGRRKRRAHSRRSALLGQKIIKECGGKGLYEGVVVRDDGEAGFLVPRALLSFSHTSRAAWTRTTLAPSYQFCRSVIRSSFSATIYPIASLTQVS